MKRIKEYYARRLGSNRFLRRMTCPVRPSRGSAAAVVVPQMAHYSRNFHAPVFKTVTVVSPLTVVILPAPLKIVYGEDVD